MRSHMATLHRPQLCQYFDVEAAPRFLLYHPKLTFYEYIIICANQKDLTSESYSAG